MYVEPAMIIIVFALSVLYLIVAIGMLGYLSRASKQKDPKELAEKGGGTLRFLMALGGFFVGYNIIVFIMYIMGF